MKIQAIHFPFDNLTRPFLLALACLLFQAFAANAAVQPHANSDTVSLAKEAPQPLNSLAKKGDNFTYRLEGRPDPFLPFLTEKTQVNPDEVVESHEKLTGMQLFEPGQLTLVALVHTPEQKFAMVEDVSGKGYIIKQGTKIGRRGVVTEIIPNKVVIEETAMTRSGKKLTNTIVMVLRKEEKKK